MLVSSGEPFTEELLDGLRAAAPSATVILNVYGCTEVAADATSFEANRMPQSRRTTSVEASTTIDSPLRPDAVHTSR